MRPLLPIAALCLAAIATPLCARPFTLDDLLGAEEFGQVSFDPSGRYLVFERLVGHASSGPFDYTVYPSYRRGRLYLADTKGGPARPLTQAGPGEGHTAGPFSPDGARMVVLRLKGRDWEAGVVSLASGQVRWLGLMPEIGQLGQTIAWRSDHELVIAARGNAPPRLRSGWEPRAKIAANWQAAARGDTPAVAVVGSGRFADAGETGPSGRLVLVDVDQEETSTLAVGDFYDLEVSPDGRQVAAMADLEDLPADPKQLRRVASPTRRRNLILVDLESRRRTTPCLDCDLATHLVAWSPTSTEVLAYGRRVGEGWDAARILRLSRQGVSPVEARGLAPVLSYTGEGHEFAPATWIAGDPLIYAQPTDGSRADWYRLTLAGPVNLTSRLPSAPPSVLAASDGASVALLAGDVPVRIDAQGKVTRLSRGQGFAQLPPQGAGLSNRHRLNAPPKVGWFISAGRRSKYLASNGLGQLGPKPGSGGAVAVTNSAAAAVRASSDQVEHLQIRRVGGSDGILMALNPGFAQIDFAQVRQILGKDASGARVSHWLFLPAQSSAGRRPPLVVVPYPGVRYDEAPPAYGRGVGRFAVNPQVLTAAGYAVLVPSLPRSSGIEPGQGHAQQILAAVDVAAATGAFDPERLALWGHSFGGYGSLMAATQSARFQAVIASAAATNLASMRGAFDPRAEASPADGLGLSFQAGWTELGQGNLRAMPWTDPDIYVRNSPVFAADKIKAPVLLIHGDSDFVRLAQAQELFASLHRQDKDAMLITVFGEGHIVASPGNVKETYRLALDWLATVLGPSEGDRQFQDFAAQASAPRLRTR